MKKKTPKCPLCGTPLKAIRGYDVHGITTDWVAGCYNCFFQSSHFWKTKKACIEDMDRLVSLFPPIMRVQVGDKLHFIDRSLKYQYWATLTDVDVNDAWIRTDKGSCRPDDVLKWPWELEQKGDRQ